MIDLNKLEAERKAANHDWQLFDFYHKNWDALVAECQPEQSPQEIVDKCNALARLFYASLGYQVEEGYKFHEAHHPQERGMWNQAATACYFFTGIDVQDAAEQVDE